MNSRGITLVILISFIMAVVVIANIALVLMSNQGRFGHLQVSRIQAHYAALAGINYALERLRVNDANWPIPDSSSPYSHDLCRGCISPDINEPDLPDSIVDVTISVSDSDDDGIVEISATADYTYN
ncbi:hypothetical protein ACFL1D_00730 [Candidatus Omnitrophota bacterium]